MTPANDNRGLLIGAQRIGVHVHPDASRRLLLVGPGGDHGAMVTARTVAPSSGKCAAVTGAGNLRPLSAGTAAALLALFAAVPARGGQVDRMA